MVRAKLGYVLAAVFACATIVTAAEGGRAEKWRCAAPDQVALLMAGRPPAGAVVLFSGDQDQIHDLWYERYSTNPAGWTVAGGIATPNGHDISTKHEYRDAYVHVEFRCPADENGNPRGHGNSGVGLQGRYEVQILNSYGKQPEKHECAAFYDEKPPMVNACRKAGDWQTFDIIFRAPRFDGTGKLTENPRATVFQNGVLVQNNEEFSGMTGIQYGQYKEMTKTGPLILQGDHDPVQFRNVWIVPLGG